MTKTLEQVQDFWRTAAQAPLDADGLRPTARDPFLQEVVETLMERHLAGGRLLDVGCGDGLSTLRFAPRMDGVVGVDFVQEYVDRAREHAAADGVRGVEFEQADVMDLAPVRERHGTFDVATSIRCLINLATTGNQDRGLAEIAACVKPGGLYLTSEGWLEGIEGINRRRVAVGLPEMTMTDYNLLIRRGHFEEEASKYFTIEGYLPLGYYLFTSRVLMPAYVAPERPTHSHDLNRLAAEFQVRGGVEGEFGDCDYAGIYVLRRT